MRVNYAKLHEVTEAVDKAIARGQSFGDHWQMYMSAEQRAMFADRDEFERLARAQFARVTR